MLGNVGYRPSIASNGSSPGLGLKPPGLGMRLSTADASLGNSFYSAKDSVEYNLYCINVRAL